MAVSKDIIVFLTVLMTLAVASNARVLATKTDDFDHHLNCSGDDASHLGACYNKDRYSDEFLCGKAYRVQCRGGGDPSSGNPCNGYGHNFVTVIMVGQCINPGDADIQISSIAYDLIVSDHNSVSISVSIVPAV